MGVMERYQKSKKEKETSVGVMARYEMNKKYESLDVSNVDDAYISSFVSDANTFFGKFGEGKEPSYTEANSALGDLDTRYQTVAGWLYKNKSNLDQKAYDDFSASLTDLKKGLDGAKEYYGQFDSEDSYRYAKKVAGIQNMSAAELEKKLGGDAIAYTTPDGANITWQSLYEKKKKEEDAEALYQTLAVQPDFKEYTEKGASIVNPSVKDAEGAAYLFGWRPFSKKVGNVVTYSRDNEQDIMTNELNSGYDRVGDFRYAYMTDKEVDVYNYYLAKYGEGKASDYLDSIYDDLNRRYEEKAIEKTVAFAEKFPFYASAASVAANLYSGVELLFESAFAKELDSNFLAESASAIRGTVSKKVDWEIGQFDAFDFLYNTGMSAADSVASMLTFGKGGGYVLGLSAAAQGVNDAKKRGLSDKRAFANGFISGVFEGLFETVSIGNFSVLKETASHSLKGIAKNIAKSMLVNASEETFTELANIAYDTIMNGDFSAYQTAVRSYTDSGLSESEAKRKAALDLGGQVLEAGASGALMGAGFGAVGSAMGTLKNNAETKELYGNSADALIKEGLTSPIGTESRVLAEKYQKKLSEGKTLSGGELARLVRANEAQIASEETAQNTETTEKPLGVEEYAKILKAAEDPRPSADVAAVREENVSNNISETVAESETPSPSLRDTSPVGRGLEDAKADDGGSVTLSERAVIPYRNAESDRSADENHTHDALAGASEKYGAQAGAMIATYKKGQDVDAYDRAYGMAYEMGKSGVSLSYVMNSKSTAYLTESQRKIAYETGAAASDSEAAARDGENKKAANGKTGWRRGTVKGEGVTISDLKKTFNDTQNTAYKLLSTYAEATGIDIVLFKSETNEDGQFEGAQGKFKWSENTIYVDINAGLADTKHVDDLAKYAMMRTFSHEFTHFLEKWNPVRYNEFRKAVFDTLTERGEDVHDLIQTKQAQDASGTMTYDEASREVIAEAMTDILPDANFVQDLAENHKSVFAKLLEKLKEFLDDLKAYFSTIGANRSREANALKEQVGHAVRYVENIVKLFDKVAVEAVETYQMAFATDVETTETVDEAVGETNEKEVKSSLSAAETESTVTDIADKNADLPAETSKTEQYEHFSITDNAEFGSLEIKFDGKPPQAVRDAMKDKKFRWHGKKGVWYGKADRAEIAAAIQNAYATEEKADTEVTENAEQRTEEENVESPKSIHAGRDSDVEGSSGRTQEEDGNRSRVSETVGEERSGLQEDRASERQHRDVNEADFLLKRENYIVPEKNSLLYETQKSITEEYGTECHILKASAWERQNPACAYNGKIFISEAIDEYTLATVVSHETTHVMKHKAFEPYWNFIEGTPDLINLASKDTDSLFAMISDHRSIDIFGMDDRQRCDFYDELNAAVYGLQKGGIIDNKELDYGWIPDAFYDFDAYIEALTEIHEQFKKANTTNSQAGTANKNTKEVKQNGENADNEAAVSRTHADRQGDSRVLDEVETGDVSGDVSRGDALDDAVQRERETARADHSDDAGRSERGHGEGSGESADLRRDDGLTPEEASQKAEELHEEVEEQIEQQSTETPKGKNFVIGDSLSLPNGEKARFKVNVEAIRLVKKLEAEGRYATEVEQQLLSKYVGWGGLANAFDERKADWSREYKELKELLTDEEYAAARGSTLNAHYTDISVIKAMYDGLAKLGFNGGRMLEPSSGVGNFVGAMPLEMSAKVKSWTMVELDNITGLIAKYLYPNADVRIQGFEKANIPNNFMDVAISNVPFGDFPITDKAYPKKVTSSIHNYFFAKTLDKVRPGGIVMFITSSYTMNSKDSTVRRYIMQRADLLGAVRLPDSAFKGNAGTEVVTDILILKKRAENTPYTGENFLEAPWSYPVKGNYNGAHINDYFTEHPEMVLGTPSMDGGMYRGGSLTYKALEGKGSLADQIREAFSHIKGKMDYPARLSPEKTNFAVERAAGKTKQNGFVSKEGKIFQNQDGSLVPVEVNAKVAERISGMLGIRDAAKNLLNYQQQGLKESEIKKARQTLNRLYDDYVKKYGFLNASANKSAFKEDPDCYSLFALEHWDSEKKKAIKADIFTKNTVAPNRTVTSAKDVTEGLIVSVNQTGGVDVALIARLTGKTGDEVRRELIDSRLAYKNRDGLLETAETYLSGNVRAKIRDAEAMVPMDADYQKNVEALKAIVPKDVSYQEIAVQPGTPWIPNSVYSDFAAYMLGGRNTEWRQDVDVTRNPETGNFTVELKSGNLKYGANNTQRWGTPRRSFLDLFDAMLNSKSVVVKIKLDDGTSVVDKDATAAANEKIENITKEFSEWLWKDEARRAELATLYNEVFNSIVTPKYNGENLTVNGLVSWATLRPHQKDAVQRVISSGGNTLLAHKVGAGKTLEMAASAMKLRELGLIKKPMFAVPKSLVAQWGKEFHDFFPTAKLLVAEATDFTAANRKTFMNRIANGDYDAVIVSYEQFERLPMSADFTRELYREQVDSVIAAIEEAKAEKGAKALSVKDLEKKRKSLQVKIDKLTDSAKDEGNIDFEELGVDSLFIDEAHNFKNLFYTTSMTNVAGLGNKDGSKRAFDLYTKVRYLQKLNGGRGIVFATATPVMNSMSEMYIMQKYLQPDVLNQLGLTTFDAWAKQFGEVVNGVEIKPSGQGYRIKQSFSRFKNMSELQLLFRNFADVLTDVPGLKIPKMKGGKVNVVVCEPGQFQKDYMKELEKRADNVKNVDPSVDNMLKITSDGRKISYTQRMIDPTLPYEEGCKIYRCADNVVKEYEASADVKGTQIIFCDMATPKGKSKTESDETATDSDMDMESARLYDDIKARLISGGIPEKEIAFIHEADTDAKKTKLFADVNDGKVRVLIGSTGKMGVGMNAQKRIVAIHHLDAPWRPGDVEQRDGRAFRQKNMNDEVSKYTYVTEGSFDARLWDILERKQNFIGQIMNGENVGRETEDTGEVTLSAAEVKALASGSPLIMEQVQLDTDIKKLESLQRAHRSAMRSATERLEKDKGIIDILKRKIASGKADMASTVDTYSEGKFAIHIGGQKFTDKKDAGVALVAEATAKANIQGYTSIGTFAGFEMRVIKTDEGIKGVLQGKESYPFSIYSGNPTYGIGKLVAAVEGISESVNQWNEKLKATEDDLAEQKKLIAEPFAKQAELDRKRLRYKEVMDILNPKEEQSTANLDDEKEQAQSRRYLDDAEKDEIAVRSFSYDELIGKGELTGIIKNGTEVPLNADGSIDAKKIVSEVLKYCLKIQTKSSSPTYFIRVPDIGRNVQITEKGITHGFFSSKAKNKKPSPHDLLNAKISFEIPEILANSIEVNRSYRNDNPDISYAHIMIGAVGVRNRSGITEYYAVRSVIEERKNLDPMLIESEILGKLHAVNAKKIGLSNLKITENNVTRGHDNTYFGYSIPQLLEDVKDIFDDTFSVDVYDKLETKRSDSDFSKNLLYQQRTATLSDREVLELAAKDIRVDELTEAEQNALGIFEDRLDKLGKLQEKRAEQGKLYKEQQFGAKVDRKAASETLERMKVLDGQIQRATADVLSVEEKQVLKRVLEKARKVVEAEERKHGKELLDRWRERRDNAAAIKKYRDRLRFDVDELSAWILKPDHKNAWKHVPDALKNTVIPFLSSINFMSKRSLNGGDATASDKKFIQNTKALAEAIKTNIDIYGLYSGYNDLPADFMERLQTFIESVQNLIGKSGEEFVINKMTSEELKDLSQIVRTLKKYIIQINRFHSNAMYQHVYEAGDDSIHFLAGLDNAGSHAGKISNFVLWQQMRPAYAFERFGNGGKAIYDELRRGQAKLAFNTKEIQSFAEKAYTEKEVKTWENEIKEFSLGGDLVKIPVSGIMSLYELSKDPEALEHISGGGIRVATYTYKGKKISDVGHIITPEDLNAILSSLTQRQIEVADALQKYMATQGAKWGNHVSVARFGEELFTKEHYFPINSDGRHLQATADEKPEGAALYALLNMSFTKSRRKGANNRIVVYSIFDVFANHMASMAQYNAMALPILDALKWFNYQQTDIGEDEKKEILGSVREQMARVYGVPEETKPGSGNKGYAETFVVNILKAFNGTEAQGTPYDTSALKSLRRYNMAQVAYNLRVVVQQPLAITRAAMLIDYTSIMKGLKLKPSEIRSNIEEMQKYSGIAAWKSLGFYDVNISRGLTTLIKQDETWMDKVGNIGMWGAEKMDLWAWASMWSACKAEVTKKERLTPEDEGFYEAVTKLFEDVIYKTQVVDSILTKNEFMRDKGFAARAIGSFMSEPVTTASMVVDAFDKFHHDIKRGMTRRQAWKHNSRHIGRTLYVYGVSAVILAAVQAAADAFRDDDEYENYGEKWVEAFIGNVIDELAPFNKLPIVSDLYEIMKAALEKLGVDTYGNPPQSVIMQWWDSLVKGVEIISDKINGEDTNYTWYGGVSKLLQAVSGMMGLPMASATREIVAAWNNTIGAMAPSLKVKIYDAGARSEIRYAYIDGYLTEKEATKALIEKGIAEDENDAYFILKEFDAEGEYSRYGSLLSAVKTLSPIRAEMKELVSHGYTEKEIVSKIKSEIGKWYRSGEITRAETEKMLMKYADIDRETMKKTVDKWSCVIVTGIAYEDIDDKYLAGEITKQRAIQMYMRYGHMTKEEATKKVDRLKE